jgi:hypothetical protein
LEPVVIMLWVWVLAFSAVALWAALGQMAYFRLCRRKQASSFESIVDLGRKSAGDIPRFFRGLPRLISQGFEVLEQRQDDPELEKARARVGRRFLLTVATAVTGFLAFMVTAFLSTARH